MICDVANAYPSNGVCLDANKKHEFKYTFYGDYAIGHDIYLYDGESGEKLSKFYLDRGEHTDGYYNGEEIGSTVLSSSFEHNKMYMWKARIYNKQVSSASYPDILVTSGITRPNPIIKSKVVDVGGADLGGETFIAIEANLALEIPSYIFIGEESRKIISYNDVNGVIEVDKVFSVYPVAWTEVIINNVAMDNPTISDTSNVIFISPNNTTIQATTYKPESSTDSDVPNVYINIGDNYYAIIDHDTKNGILTVNGVVSHIDVGTQFTIYSNYIDTPFFNFYVKSFPLITVTSEFLTTWKTLLWKCTALLNNSTIIKSYHWEIYRNIDNKEVLVEKSKEIFSGRLEYLARIILPSSSYTARVIATTKDNAVLTGETVYGWDSNIDGIKNLKSQINHKNNSVKLTWENITNNTSYTIMRTNSNGVTEYLETIMHSTTNYYDYKAANNETYTYHVIPKYGENVCKMVDTEIHTSFNSISIYFLSEVEYERPPELISKIRIDTNFMYPETQYKIEKAYTAEMNLGEMKITHNINRDVQVGYNGMPLVTVGADNYDSFPLEFTFGQLSCETNEQMEIFMHSHKDYIVWRDYVASGLPVVIKDYMGNVWFGTITSHSPTPDTIGKPNLYKISLDFTQTKKTDEIRILTD